MARHDRRLRLHLNSLRTFGADGWTPIRDAITAGDEGAAFCGTVVALEGRQDTELQSIFDLAKGNDGVLRAMMAGFAFAPASALRGQVAALLAKNDTTARRLGLRACVLHRVDPGPILLRAVEDVPAIRAEALRAVGELGKTDALGVCRAALTDTDDASRFWAAWSGVLLGDRADCLETLRAYCLSQNRFRGRAIQLALRAPDHGAARELLRQMARHQVDSRILIQGAAIVGDSFYVPWLLEQIDVLKFSRLAGESFSIVTGVDVTRFDRKVPENYEPSVTDDPKDDNVAIDQDEDLPWPDPERIRPWWDANKHRFQEGVRYFVGEAVSATHCKRVLRTGRQRERIAAALSLSLLQPGTPLFPTDAPGWRQARLVAALA